MSEDMQLRNYIISTEVILLEVKYTWVVVVALQIGEVREVIL